MDSLAGRVTWSKRITAALTAVLLAACGPSAMERRTCDIYVEAGGDRDLTATDEPRILAQAREMHAALTESLRALPGYETPEAMAANQLKSTRASNAEARAAVALRLGLSQREVDAALAKCLADAVRAARRQR